MPTKVRLTQGYVNKLTAPTASGKPAVVYDTQTPGFAILLSGTTSRRSYIACYGVKFQQRAIEDVSLISLDEAREKAVDMIRLMKKGIDPNKVKPAPQSSTITLSQLLERRLADEQKPLRAASVTCYRNLMSKYLADWLDKPVTEITSDMVYDRHRAIFASVPKTEKRDGRTVADLAIRVLGSLFTWGSNLRGKDRVTMPEVNPCLGVDLYITPKDAKARVRTSHVTDTDLPMFWAALDAEQINPCHAAMIKLMLLTGLRINSARQLKWNMVDLESRVISIPASLMKGRRPLNLPIVRGLFEILTAWRACGTESSGYLFPSSVYGKHITTLTDALKATGITVTPHDLRRTFARACKKAGINKWIAASLLAHSANSQTDDYVGDSDADDLREPMQKVTDHLLRLCGANVIKLAA